MKRPDWAFEIGVSGEERQGESRCQWVFADWRFGDVKGKQVVCVSGKLWGVWVKYPEMVTISHFALTSVGEIVDNLERLFCQIYGSKQTTVRLKLGLVQLKYIK